MQRLERIKALLEEKKGEDIELLDMRQSEYFVSFVLICTTMGERHAKSLLDFLKSSLKPAEQILNIEESSSWIVIDLGDIMIHLLDEEARNKYNIEEFLKELKS